MKRIAAVQADVVSALSAYRALLTVTLWIAAAACTGPSAHLRDIPHAPALPADCEPWLVRPDQAVPADAQLLGEARYGDTGFSVSCDERRVRERLRLQACRSGAGVVRIVKHSPPNLFSTCYRVVAEFYKLGPTPLADAMEVIPPHPEYDVELASIAPAP